MSVSFVKFGARGGSEWAMLLSERGWSIEQAARMLQNMRLQVSPADVQLWCMREIGFEEAQVGRAALFALLGQLDAGQGRVPMWFEPAEFGQWWPWMCPGLVAGLDVLRGELGVPVEISPAKGSLGRWEGRLGSLHNVERHGLCYAADVLIPVSWPVDEAFFLAQGLKIFSGIGVYPFWKPRAGLHLDMRHLAPQNPTPGRVPRSPSTWGAVRDKFGNQVYVTAAEALARWGEEVSA